MFIEKNLSLGGILRFTGFHILWITLWVLFVTIVHEVFHPEWMSVPWLPLSIIATAVAFYVGFKNNQAYERLWEARKIWGSIVNDSRAWGASVRAYISNHFTDDKKSESELDEICHRLIYRHIAWLYALRSQLLIPTPWEHSSQGRFVGGNAERIKRNYGIGLLDDEVTRVELKSFLPKDEHDTLINYANTATQIIEYQSQDLKKLRGENVIEDFRHMELQNILNTFYTHQGKAERIKKFPLPRQYGGMSAIFVGIFIFLLPFGMVTEFHKLGEIGPWISIPFSVLIAWLYMTMELVGDYSENPFAGLGNDIPMLALSRTIEIDLLEMLGEKDLPPKIEPVNGVLM